MSVLRRFFGELGFQPPDGQHLGRSQPRRVRGAKRGDQLRVQLSAQSVGVVPGGGCVDTNRLRVSLPNDVTQTFPLRGVVGIDDREQAGVIEPSDRQTFHTAVTAAVEEHQNRAPPGRVGFERRHRSEYGVVVVLARHDDPHVETLAPHESREQRVEAAFDPCTDQRRLFTVGQHAVVPRASSRKRCNEREAHARNERRTFHWTVLS